MEIRRGPPPQAPVPGAPARVQQGAPAAGPKPLGLPGTRVQGDSMRKEAAAAPELPAGLDLPTMLTLARSVAFATKRFQRGEKISPRDGNNSHRSASAPDASQGTSEGLGAMSTADAQRDITSGHPLYGRYLDQWLKKKPNKGKGKLLLQMLRDRLGELKDVVRNTI